MIDSRQAWNRFLQTGSVQDYLNYKKAQAYQRILAGQEDDSQDADQNQRDHSQGTGQWR